MNYDPDLVNDDRADVRRERELQEARKRRICGHDGCSWSPLKGEEFCRRHLPT